MKNKAVEKLIDELTGCFEDFGRIVLLICKMLKFYVKNMKPNY